MKMFLLGLIVLVSTASAFAESEVELPKVKGVVRQIDFANTKVKIKHEEIPNLNMPAMTMTFVAADPVMLEGLANGDKVLFTSDEIDGVLMVLWIEKRVSEQ